MLLCCFLLFFLDPYVSLVPFIELVDGYCSGSVSFSSFFFLLYWVRPIVWLFGCDLYLFFLTKIKRRLVTLQ